MGNIIFNWKAFLTEYHISEVQIIAFIVIAFLFVIWISRELMSWYFKIDHLVKRAKAIEDRLYCIEKNIEKLISMNISQQMHAPTNEKLENPETELSQKNKFPLLFQ